MVHSPHDGQLDSSDRDPGEMAQGNRHGHWVDRWTYNSFSDESDPEGICIDEGHYVDGRKNGKWVQRCVDGSGEEGSYVDGERHGRWVRRFEDGTVWEETYVNGEQLAD